MESKLFIWNIILWTVLLVSTISESDTLNITEEGTTATTATTIIRTRPKPKLKLCQCASSEVMNHTEQCQPWENGTTVPMKPFPDSETQHLDTAEFSVTVGEPQCQYHQVDLQQEQFILRVDKGDLLVIEGDLRGLRVSDYCIHHRRSGDQVEVTARGCVSMPVIPKCCPIGKHMNNGDCVTNTMTSMQFNPPLTTGPHGDKFLAGATFPWTDNQVHANKLSCAPDHVLKKVELDGQKAYLGVLPRFVLLTWRLDGAQSPLIFPPKYCVDGPADDIYYAYTCQLDLGAHCENKNCTYKCCPEGQVVSKANKYCVPSDVPLKPHFPSPPSSLTTLYGFPTCKEFTDITDFQFFENGTLIRRNTAYSFPKFCTDIFKLDNSTEPGALLCDIWIQQTTWHKVKRVLFLVSTLMSCAFLALLLLLFAWVPKLREHGGMYQVFHAASLFVAFLVNLILLAMTKEHNNAEEGILITGTCVPLALVLQFSMLSAGFWLNTMCFYMWRLFRTKVKNQDSFLPSEALWKYLLYGIGGPLTITLITIIVQYGAPNDGSISWLVHPHIGEGRCWFKSDKELLPYFYLPGVLLILLNFIFLGLAYHYVRIIRRDHKSSNEPSISTEDSAETAKTSSDIASFWQYFFLIALTSVSWVMELLQWLTRIEDLGTAAKILSYFSGVFVFFVFLSHNNKRAHLKTQLPKLLEFNNMLISQTRAAQAQINITSNFHTNKTSPIIKPKSTSTPSAGIALVSMTRKDCKIHPVTPLPEIIENNI